MAKSRRMSGAGIDWRRLHGHHAPPVMESIPLTLAPLVPYDGLYGFSEIIIWYLGLAQAQAQAHLFTNDFQPQNNVVVGSYVEATAGGLTALPLPPPTNKGIDAFGKDVWTFGNLAWTSTGPGLPAVIYGWWIDCVDPITLGKRVLWTQRLPNPWASWEAGQVFSFEPTLGFVQCFE